MQKGDTVYRQDKRGMKATILNNENDVLLLQYEEGGTGYWPRQYFDSSIPGLDHRNARWRGGRRLDGR